MRVSIADTLGITAPAAIFDDTTIVIGAQHRLYRVTRRDVDGGRVVALQDTSFGSITTVSKTGNGSVTIFDVVRAKVSIVSLRDNAVESEIQLPTGARGFPVWAAPRGRDHGYAVRYRPANGVRGALARRREFIRTLREDGSFDHDSLVAEKRATDIQVSVGRGTAWFANPFAGAALMATTEDGAIVEVAAGAGIVTIYDSLGRRESSFGDEFPVCNTSRADVDSIVAALDFPSDFRPFAAAGLEKARPSRWAPITAAVVDDRDRVWVGVRTQRGPNTEWRVYSKRGEREGRLELATPVTLRAVRGDFAVGVVSGRDGTPELRGFHLDRLKQ